MASVYAGYRDIFTQATSSLTHFEAAPGTGDASCAPLMLDTARDVPTPEGIELSLRLAGPSARALAWLIDLVVRVAVIAALGTVLGVLGKFGMGLILIIWFALEWLYPTAFEVWFAGATPGKRSLGLVVLHDDGTPIRLPASFTRNLLRAVDFMPVLYGFGLVSMLLSREFKRLGDIAAGTVVVYREAASQHAAVPACAADPAAAAVALVRAARDPGSGHPLEQPHRRARGGAGRAGPASDRGAHDAAALQRLIAIANHLIGRRA